MYHINIKNQVQQQQIQFLTSCTQGQIAIYNVIIALCQRNGACFPSYKKIAQYAGCTVNTVGTAVNKFHKAGFLWKVGRFDAELKRNISNLYKIPNFIWDLRQQLKWLLPALQFVSVSFLLPTQTCQIAKLGTNVSSYFFKNNRTVNCSVTVNRTVVNLETVKRSEVVMSNSTNAPEAREAVKTGTQAPPSAMPDTAAFDPKRISEPLNRVKHMNFTLEQLVDLSGYPKESIEYADREIGLTKKPITDRFKYFAFLAYRWCKERNIQPNYRQRNFWNEVIRSYQTVLPIEQKTVWETVKQTNGKTSADNFAEQKPKPEPKQLYPSALMEDYLDKFRSMDGYRDNDAMIGKKGWDHKLAYADARSAWWKEKEFNATKANELERWEHCLTPEVEQALDKADNGLMAGSKDLLLQYRTNAINQLREELRMPESVPVTVMESKRVKDNGTHDPTTHTKHLCEIGCGCDGWTRETNQLEEPAQPLKHGWTFIEKQPYDQNGDFEEVY